MTGVTAWEISCYTCLGVAADEGNDFNNGIRTQSLPPTEIMMVLCKVLTTLLSSLFALFDLFVFPE